MSALHSATADVRCLEGARDGAPIWSSRQRFAVLGAGTALPGEPLPTDELLERLVSRFAVDVRRRGRSLGYRLGIATRHISRALDERFEGTRPGHTNAELAAIAVKRALKEAGARVADLAYLIAHTATPGELVPPNVVRIARLLNYRGPFVELRQACTGFANALVFAHALLETPGSGPIAIVGSETGSVYFDPLRAAEDQGQLVNLLQMGDGAAALLLGPDTSASRQRLSQAFFGQSSRGLRPGVRLVSGGSDVPAHRGRVPEFEHDFALVREHGMELMEWGAAAARSIAVDPRDVTYVIPHQANGRMAELLAPRLGISPGRVFVNANRLGNTGSAAIWLAFAELRSRMKLGESVLVLGAEATGHMFGGFRYVHG